jgi:hypothetical protein
VIDEPEEEEEEEPCGPLEPMSTDAPVATDEIADDIEEDLSDIWRMIQGLEEELVGSCHLELSATDGTVHCRLCGLSFTHIGDVLEHGWTQHRLNK